MRRSSTRWRPSGIALSLCGLLLAAGCVTRGTYREVVDQRDALQADKGRLQERVKLLEASTKSLDAERVSLIDQMEDLRQQREDLEINVVKLRKTEAELKATLDQQEAELASRGDEIDRLRSTYKGLVSDLEAELAAGQIEIQQLREGLQLNMAQEVLFASGSAEVSRSGRAVLAKVAERVKGVPYDVVVQGHTDNVPISTERFPSNWELAGARASRVVRILADDGVPPARLAAVSFGSHQPRASNDTAQGRARNRRIEITLKPIHAAEEASAPAAPGGKGAGATPAAAPDRKGAGQDQGRPAAAAR